MVEGMGEVFGSELAKNKTYNFLPGSKVAVFSFHGCVIKISFDVMLELFVSFCKLTG